MMKISLKTGMECFGKENKNRRLNAENDDDDGVGSDGEPSALQENYSIINLPSPILRGTFLFLFDGIQLYPYIN